MKVTWKQPATMNDGTPFTKARFAGWTLSVDGAPAVAIPLTWDGSPNTVYSFDLAALSLSEGNHKITMQTTEVDGDLSAPSPEVTFTYKAVPSPPLVQSVA